MLICFGLSWPFSIWKSWKSGTVGSKSLVFMVFVFTGYLAGITHKILYSLDIVLVFYIINALMVATDGFLYIRNQRLQRRREAAAVRLSGS